MSEAVKKRITPLATLVVMFFLVWFSPSSAIDPWNLLSPKKIATMIFALTFIQAMGAEMAQILGLRAGAILAGFLGGLISSTATTAALAKRTKVSAQEDVSIENLTFLSATAAMLFEGLVLLLTGTTDVHFNLSLIFLGPLLVTAIMIFRHSRDLVRQSLDSKAMNFRLLPILKLAAYIAAILALSKVLQNFFGDKGLVVLTFLVSLFEIHGSVIANVQLHDSGIISIAVLGGLLAVSVVASFLSKLFLIYSMASRAFKIRAAKSTVILFLASFGSWVLFLMANIR